MGKHLNHMESAARRKVNAPEDWRAYHYEVITGGYLIIGSVPVGKYKSGPRKGSPKWEGEGVKVVVTEADVETETSLYVKTTGNCPNCFGEKTEFLRWSKAAGLETQTCRSCHGSGRAPEVLPTPVQGAAAPKEGG